MPRSEQERGEPNLELISTAIKACEKSLSDAANRRTEFRYLLERVSNVYPDVRWAQTFIEMGNAGNWDTWAVESLPSLCVPCSPPMVEEPGEYIDVYVWKHIYSILSEAVGIKVIEGLCHDLVLKIRMRTADLGVLQVAASDLESLRSTNPYGSDSSMIGVVLDALNRLTINLEKPGDAVSETNSAELTDAIDSELSREIHRFEKNDVMRIVPLERLHGVHKEMLRQNDLIVSS
jgi:hypothetical protein